MGSTWKPWGACRTDGVPSPGALVADEHRVWLVVDVVALPCESDCPGARTHRLILDAQTGTPLRREVETNAYGAWWTYPGRYPLCSCCGEPAPCRAQLLDQAAECELARMRCFEEPGVCPACHCPVAPGQESVTFPDNLDVPLGAPVTFHAEDGPCRRAALGYQRRWLAAYPRSTPRLAVDPGSAD